MTSSGSAHSVSRMTLLVGLLAATVTFASLLAYEAHDAARAERVTAERALRDYASLAAYELQSAARKRLDGALERALGPVTAAAAVSPYEPAPPLERLAESAHAELTCADAPPNANRIYFRVDLRDGTVVSDPPTRASGGVVEAARRFVRERAKPEAPLGLAVSGDDEIVALGVRYARLGAPVAVYGFTTCAAAIGPDLFGAVLREHKLLPAAAAIGASNEMLFAVTITDSHGAPILQPHDSTATPRSDAVTVASPFSAETVLDAWNGWRASVTLRPAALEGLLVRPPVRSRVPLLVGLMVMTAGLGVVAMLQIRREHELARLRADFTSNVSHELRTPLAQILLFGETLSLGRARSEAERRFAADTIVLEARRLMRMVDNVLTFSRQRVGASDMVRRPLALRPVVEEIVAAFSPLAKAAGVRLDLEVEAGSDALADSGALRQILLNLLDNAIKYGPPGQRIRVVCEPAGDRVRLAVEDEGPGIAPTDRERIWSPYVRLRRSGRLLDGAGPAGAQGGSGIGLAVVRELTESLGGRAWVEATCAESGREIGARFVVELARSPDGAPGPPPEFNGNAIPANARHQSIAEAGTATPAGAPTHERL
jgi:signal transduction histidine kinase